MTKSLADKILSALSIILVLGIVIVGVINFKDDQARMEQNYAIMLSK